MDKHTRLGDSIIEGIRLWNPVLLDTGIDMITLPTWFCSCTSRFCQSNKDNYISKPPDGWERWDLCGMNHISLLHHGLLGTGQNLNEGLEGFFVKVLPFVLVSAVTHSCCKEQKKRELVSAEIHEPAKLWSFSDYQQLLFIWSIYGSS